MNFLIRFLGWCYTQSIRLYPLEFRTTFGDEMTKVFTAALYENLRSGARNFCCFILREVRDWPISIWREHLRSTKGIGMNETNIKRPDWFFYPGWILASIFAITLSWFAYFLVIGVVTSWIGHTIQVNGQTRITEDYLFFYIFLPMLSLLSGIFQYSLLRLYVPKMGGWILATMAGYLLMFGAMGLLIRVFEGAFLLLWNGALAFAAIGGLIGLSQWVFLRRRIPKAGWWILASMLGWGLAVLGRLTPVRYGSALAQLLTTILLPAIVACFAWWYLLRPKAQQENPLSG